MQKPNRALPHRDIKYSGCVAQAGIENEVLALGIVAQVDGRSERSLGQDVGVLERTWIGRFPAVECNGKPAFDVVRLRWAQIPLFHHQAVPHVKGRIGREVVPWHTCVLTQKSVDRLNNGHFALHFKSERIDLVVQEDVIQMP